MNNVKEAVKKIFSIDNDELGNDSVLKATGFSVKCHKGYFSDKKLVPSKDIMEGLTHVINSLPSNEQFGIRAFQYALCIAPGHELRLAPTKEKGRYSFYSQGHKSETTIGRFARRILGITPEQISDPLIGKMSSDLSAYVWPEDMNKVVSLFGEEIVKAYSVYEGSSCMKWGNSKYVEVYAKNPDIVRLMAIMEGEEEHERCYAKAIVWMGKEREYLDRVYHADEMQHYGRAIYMKAINEGVDVSKNPYCGRNDIPSGEFCLDVSGCEYMPYFDSLSGCLKQEGSLVYLTPDREDFHSVHGLGLSKCECGLTVAINIEICPSCNEELYSNCCSNCHAFVSEEETYLVYAESYCEECYDSLFFMCDSCGCTHNRDDGRLINEEALYCEDCTMEYASYCEHCNEWFFNSNMHTMHDSDPICEYCFESDGAYCEECRDSFFTEDMEEDTNGNMYCQTCASDKLFICEDCEEYCHNEEANEVVYGRVVCTSCTDNYIECSKCESMVRKEDAIKIDNRILCEEECYKSWIEDVAYEIGEWIDENDLSNSKGWIISKEEFIKISEKERENSVVCTQLLIEELNSCTGICEEIDNMCNLGIKLASVWPIVKRGTMLCNLISIFSIATADKNVSKIIDQMIKIKRKGGEISVGSVYLNCPVFVPKKTKIFA
jgi:hypothetical protein